MATFCGHSNRTYVSINQEFLAKLNKSQHIHDNVRLLNHTPENIFHYIVPYAVRDLIRVSCCSESGFSY
jgi:hypothetical protein